MTDGTSGGQTTSDVTVDDMVGSLVDGDFARVHACAIATTPARAAWASISIAASVACGDVDGAIASPSRAFRSAMGVHFAGTRAGSRSLPGQNSLARTLFGQNPLWPEPSLAKTLFGRRNAKVLDHRTV